MIAWSNGFFLSTVLFVLYYFEYLSSLLDSDNLTFVVGFLTICFTVFALVQYSIRAARQNKPC